MFQSRINAQAIALEIVDVSLAPWVLNTGFVVDIKKRKVKEVKNTMGSALVVAFGMERTAKLFNRQCAEDLDFENLQRGGGVTGFGLESFLFRYRVSGTKNG